MKNTITLKAVPFGLAFVSFVICLVLCGQINGFEQALWAAANPGGIPNKIKFSLDLGRTGPNFYEFIVTTYIVIAICFCIYGVAKYFENSTPSLFFPLVPLGIIVCGFSLLLLAKHSYLAENGGFGKSHWIINSIPFDWFCLVTASILLIFQVLIVTFSYRSSPHDSFS